MPWSMVAAKWREGKSQKVRTHLQKVWYGCRTKWREEHPEEFLAICKKGGGTGR